MGVIYARVARRHGWRGSASALDHRFHAVLARRGGAGSKAAWRTFVTEVFDGPVGPGFFDDLFDTFSGPDVWQVFPDVRPTLARLRRQGIQLGVVSNWDARLFGTLNGLRLSRWFDFVLASGVIGVAKPHRGIFREALKRAGVSAGEALHVGDSLEEDARGPRRVGMVGVWLHRGAEARTPYELPGNVPGLLVRTPYELLGNVPGLVVRRGRPSWPTGHSGRPATDVPVIRSLTELLP